MSASSIPGRPEGAPTEVVVVGGGVAGLAAAHRLLAAAAAGGPPVACTVVEAAPAAGGKVVTERVEGFVVEGGPDSLLVHKPWALALIEELGLGDRLMASNDDRRRVFVARGDRLVPVPEGIRLVVPTRIGPLLASPLLSWRGKARMGLEWLVPARRPGGAAASAGAPGPAADDESLADFIRRRLGREALERLAEPIMAHIHLADPEWLSMAATFPALLEMERRHGGLLRAVRAGRRPTPGRPARAEGRQGAPAGSGASPPPGGSPRPAPLFLTLRGGLGELVEALAARIAAAPGGRLLTGRRAVALTPTGPDPEPRAWTVRLDDGRELAAGAVVLALPAFGAAELTAAAAPELATALAAIRYVSAATISLAYREADLPAPLEGFGFFVPRGEGRRVVAATFTSTKFEDRAPAGHALVRAFVGGAGAEETAALDDPALLAAVRADFSDLLALSAEPVLARIHRWPRGYPQYEVGHLGRVAAAEALAPPGIFLAGSAFHGVGIPDCVRSGEQTAARILDLLVKVGPIPVNAVAEAAR